jgi:hypothetical protein
MGKRMSGGGGIDDNNPGILRVVPYLSGSPRYQGHNKNGEKDESSVSSHEYDP